MFHIAYLSTATELFTKADLLALLEQSRIKNARLGITGILLYRGGNILQLMEGEEPVVRKLMQTIEADRRHYGIIVLLQEAVAGREYPDWSMAFRDLGLAAETAVPGFNQFLNTPLTAEEFAQQPSRVRTLLKLFKSNMR